MAFRRKSMSIAEEDAFLLTFEHLMDEIQAIPEYRDMPTSMDWLRRAACYNVPGGKQIRGRSVVAAYRALVDEPDPDIIKLTYILGWAIEIFQSCYLVTNDLVENCETRRGQICWYLVENIGDIAISDSFLLSGIVMLVLDRHFFGKPYYAEIVQLFHDIHLKTSLGHALDTESSKMGRLTGFTVEKFQKITKFKTSYCSFYLPIACAMILAGRTKAVDEKDIEDLVLEMGLLFQVQDDYLDCFGNPKITGRQGTDIAENKCSWLIVNAFAKASETQKAILLENYGQGKQSSHNNEARVKTVYEALKLPESYRAFEETTYKSIGARINKLADKFPTTIFAETADVIYRRQK